MAQMVQRTLVRGATAEFGEKAELPEASNGPSDLVECAEEELPKLFIERSLSSRVDYWRALYMVQIFLMIMLVPLLKPVSFRGSPQASSDATSAASSSSMRCSATKRARKKQSTRRAVSWGSPYAFNLSRT
jgi:hypothetical protein